MQSGKVDVGLSLLLEQTARSIYDKRAPGDIHPGQWAALRFFARAGRQARTVSGLSNYLGVTLGSASRATASLVRQGFIVSEVNEADRRSPLLSLTPKGQEVLKADPIKRLARAIAGIDRKKKADFANCLEQIYTALHS